jgi:hypothetical protein
MEDSKDSERGAVAPSTVPTRVLISRSSAACLYGISLSSIAISVRRGHIEAESTAARSHLYQDSVVRHVAKKREVLENSAAERQGIQARMLEERNRKIERGVVRNRKRDGLTTSGAPRRRTADVP